MILFFIDSCYIVPEKSHITNDNARCILSEKYLLRIFKYSKIYAVFCVIKYIFNKLHDQYHYIQPFATIYLWIIKSNERRKFEGRNLTLEKDELFKLNLFGIPPYFTRCLFYYSTLIICLTNNILILGRHVTYLFGNKVIFASSLYQLL